MSYIILVAGLPAAGKTTFSNYLSKEIGIPTMSKDLIKEKLYDTLGFHSRAEKIKLGIASRDIIYSLAEKSMEIGHPVVIENNFENNDKLVLIELIQKYHYKSVTIRFEGDLEVIYKRFLKRNRSPQRHLGHVTNKCYPPNPLEPIEEISFEQFRKGIVERGIRDFDVGAELICIDATDLKNVIFENILSEVRRRI